MEESIKEELATDPAIAGKVPEVPKENGSEETDRIAESDTPREDGRSQIDDDLDELRAEFPELRNLETVNQLNNPVRYAALRDLGLSPAEAYILTARRRSEYDTRSHLTSSVPVAAKTPGHGMSTRELQEMREIFGEISDSEINNLYKKVTKQERF